MATRCVVRQGCAHNGVTRYDMMSRKADGKSQQVTRRGSDWRPDLRWVLRADAIDSVQLWCTWQLIGVKRFSGCSGAAESDGRLTGSRWSSSLVVYL
jgi:hypothetical protein